MKRNTHFHFKQFSVRDDRCAMKVGTDAVLLGAWTDVTNTERILDIGAGSGIISLMLAQRTTSAVAIDAVEIDRDAAEQATENIRESPWSSRIKVHQIAVQEFSSEQQFDLIVTNPPFFNNSLRPEDKKRHQVRHTFSLSYEELLSAITRLLKPDGRFSLILPFEESAQFTQLASQYKFCFTRRYDFSTRQSKPVERRLLEFSRHSAAVEQGEILLYSEGLEWSDSYRALTNEFYLKN